MPSIAPSRSTTTTRVAKVPYLNSVPFYHGLTLGDRYELANCVPRELGEQAAAGTVAAGPIPLADFFRLEDRFDRLGHFGIAVRGRAHSALLFSRLPIRQLEGAAIAVTDESSTTVRLLRLILEQRYRIAPKAYVQGQDPAAARPPGPPVAGAGAGGDHERRAGDALLLIGDEALRYRNTNTRYPYETDLAFEWWLWQHQPFVFAVWAIRKDVGAQVKREVESAIAKALAGNLRQLSEISHEYGPVLGLSEVEVEAYLSSFVYRLGRDEEAGIAKFRELLHDPTACGGLLKADRPQTQ